MSNQEKNNIVLDKIIEIDFDNVMAEALRLNIPLDDDALNYHALKDVDSCPGRLLTNLIEFQ